VNNNIDKNEKHILGIPEMDEQHNYLYYLFDLIEKSDHVVDESKTGLLLKEIERYLLFHFSSEEHFMRMYDYNGFSVHQTDHEAMLNNFLRFLEDFDYGKLNPLSLNIFLKGWLLEHSKISDSKYALFIKEKRNLY
jgi:hemerythrin